MGGRGGVEEGERRSGLHNERNITHYTQHGHLTEAAMRIRNKTYSLGLLGAQSTPGGGGAARAEPPHPGGRWEPIPHPPLTTHTVSCMGREGGPRTKPARRNTTRVQPFTRWSATKARNRNRSTHKTVTLYALHHPPQGNSGAPGAHSRAPGRGGHQPAQPNNGLWHTIRVG